MPPFRTILVAADFSESSRDAFRVACALAGTAKARLIVLNVVEPRYIADEPVYFGQRSVAFSIGAREPGYYDAMTKRLRQFYVADQRLETECLAMDGKPAEEILRISAEARCDLIVMGTHGRTGVDRLIVGSLAETVLRKASCPVLALRSKERAAIGASEPPAVGPIRCILHPTDFSREAGAVLRVARSLAREHGTRLVILHVIPIETIPSEVLMSQIDRDAEQAAIDDKRAEVEGPDLKFPVETKLIDGDPADEVLRAAEEADCDLIVMGTHGRTGLGRLLMGSVAEAVVRRSGRPVLTVKSPHLAATSKPAEQLAGVVTASPSSV